MSFRGTFRILIVAGVLIPTLGAPLQAQFPRDYCLFEVDPGPCDDVCPRFFYNAQTGYCEPFTYGCCDGNPNNFLTASECEAACIPTAEDCLLPAFVGPCDAICPAWRYDSTTQQCEPFIYGCCEANANTFLTQGACEVACMSGTALTIPTVSTWGLAMMTLLLTISATVLLTRRRILPA